MNPLVFIKLGRQGYSQVLEKQFSLRSQRQLNKIPDTVLTVEHPRVITQGRRKADQDFRLSVAEIEKRGISFIQVNRGGKLTYHGPGQLVAYFIISLRERKLSVPRFVEGIEEISIQTLQPFGLRADRIKGSPGVWTQGRKIVSIGLSVDRGVSMHGLAINIDPDLSDFSVINPCGMTRGKMTSIKEETGSAPTFAKVEDVFQKVTREFFTGNPQPARPHP